MSNRYLSLLSLIFVLLLPVSATAELVVAPGTSTVNLAHEVSILRDAPTALDIETINTPDWQSRFVKPKVSGTALHLAQGSGVLWLRIELQVSEGVSPDWVLDIPYGNLHDIEWFMSSHDEGLVSCCREVFAILELPLPRPARHATSGCCFDLRQGGARWPSDLALAAAD
jgi:hypothetical protein